MFYLGFNCTGLLAISRVGEVLAVDVVASLLRNVVRFVGDQHPRVRYAAIDCIGQLSVDKSPDVQISLHEIVVPALLSPLTDAGNPRLQAYALAALFNFVEHCPEVERGPEIVLHYGRQILEQAINLLEFGHIMVREEAMRTIALIAGKFNSEFVPYYNRVVPLLKRIVIDAVDLVTRIIVPVRWSQ